MKTPLINLFTRLGGASREAWVLPALLAVLNLIPAGRVMAQTFTTLYNFTAGSGSYPQITNSDGVHPDAGLITNSTGNTLYGTATFGGNSGHGAVFAVNTDGTGFTNLYSFTATPPYPNNTNSDGVWPRAGLILSGKTLYGTASLGGSSDAGTVFAVNTDATGFTTLHSFTAVSPLSYPDGTNSDGAIPLAGLTLSGNILYGTGQYGGSAGNGTVFAVNTDGTGSTNLHSFTASPFGTNSDGALPSAGVILSGNTLYGTASYGGSSGNGTVFAVHIDGTGFRTLYSFTGGNDGQAPNAGLILSGNTLYGTAIIGGTSGNGTVFTVNTDGTGFATLHSFSAMQYSILLQTYTNSDGAGPNALLFSGNTLYGTASGGGGSSSGTVFAVNTDGTGFTTLHSFAADPAPYYTNSDGAQPYAGLILSGKTLYGTAFKGGSAGNGTVFSLSFRPQLTINPSGVPPSGIILSWLTNVAGFDYSGYKLQSAPTLTGPFTNLPAATNPYTNPITGDQMFFRLSQ